MKRLIVALNACLALAAVAAEDVQTIESNGMEIRAKVKGWGAVQLWDKAREIPFWRVDRANVLLPSFASNAVCKAVTVRDDGALVFTYAGPMLVSGETVVKPHLRGFLVSGAFTPKADAMVNRLDLVPPRCGSCGFYTLNNFVAQPGDANPVKRAIVHDTEGFHEHTMSDYGYLSPRPTSMLFAANDLRMMVGVTRAPVGGHGLNIDVYRSTVRNFYLLYGPDEWGWEVKAGETWRTPDFYIAFDREKDDFRSHTLFWQDLVRMGTIADPAKREIPAWHRQHQWCTWGETGYRHSWDKEPGDKKKYFAEIKKRHPGMTSATWLHVSQEMVLAGARRIRAERLPINVITIDAGWNESTANFVANTELFPDFRGMVDQLHAMGFKVQLWWSWSELRTPMCVEAVGLHNCIMNGKKDWTGRPMPDFSKKSCQEEYLKPMIRRLFSSEPGCYDCDGLKIDYAAGKVRPELPCENPEWRGEENYLVHFYGMLRQEILKYKKEPQLCACAMNWFVAEFLDTNRTGDLHGDDYLDSEMRARAIQACSPGTVAKYDFSGSSRQNMVDFIESAKRIGAIVQWGGIFTLANKQGLGDRTMTEKDFQVLRDHL